MKSISMDSSFLKRIEYYLEFARKHPKHFSNNAESVRIVFDPQKIYAAEQASLLRNQALGLPPEGSQVGIISEDPWVTVIRDAVEFSDGDIRLHTRTMNRNNEGVAVLPIFENKLILIRHFRHALRKSILEIPRGAIDENATLEQTARNELLEEIEGVAGELIPLGFIYGTTNLFANGSYLFFTQLQSLGSPQLDEGVEAIERYSVKEFESLLLAGKIQETHTISAFCQARLRGLL